MYRRKLKFHEHLKILTKYFNHHIRRTTRRKNSQVKTQINILGRKQSANIFYKCWILQLEEKLRQLC